MERTNENPVEINAIRAILDANNGARMRTWLSICSRCGLCAESCLFYLTHDKDPRMSPAYKVKNTLDIIYRKKGNVDWEFLEKSKEVVWGECTACKRCSMYCPFGIDIATMISTARSVCSSQSIIPEGLARTLDHYRETGNQMGITFEELKETCEWMAEESADEIRGLEIPIDKQGAKYMYTINPREAKYYPLDLAMAAQIFTVTQESWTIPSTGWDCTNLAMFAGDTKCMANIAKLVYDAAARLGVEKIVLTE